jgi:YebC/PmpR family DNA-binding regulatory protein
MAGHSKWAKIHRGKAIEDAKRGAIFTKLGNNIAIAAKAGADPELNFALRLAIDKAKAANMPAANIQRAVDRGSGKLGGEQIQEVLYEGYGPGGTAILVECATDNTNRTYPDVRLAFSKHGGNIAEKGAVAFQFDRKGMITVTGTGEDLLLEVLDAGAEDAIEEDGELVIYTDQKELAKVRDTLKEKGIAVTEAELTYVPQNTIQIEDESTAGKIMRLMDALDNLDDVTKTHVNFDIPEELIV